jgi:hypothetical protein
MVGIKSNIVVSLNRPHCQYAETISWKCLRGVGAIIASCDNHHHPLATREIHGILKV